METSRRMDETMAEWVSRLMVAAAWQRAMALEAREQFLVNGH